MQRPRKNLAIVAIVVAVPLFITALILSLGSWRVLPPRLIGPMFLAPRENAIYYITEEERAAYLYHSEKGQPSDTVAAHYFRYELQIRDSLTGEAKAPAVELLDDQVSSTGGNSQILGIVGDVVWAWSGKIEGYKTGSLLTGVALRFRSNEGVWRGRNALTSKLGSW